MPNTQTILEEIQKQLTGIVNQNIKLSFEDKEKLQEIKDTIFTIQHIGDVEQEVTNSQKLVTKGSTLDELIDVIKTHKLGIVESVPNPSSSVSNKILLNNGCVIQMYKTGTIVFQGKNNTDTKDRLYTDNLELYNQYKTSSNTKSIKPISNSSNLQEIKTAIKEHGFEVNNIKMSPNNNLEYKLVLNTGTIINKFNTGTLQFQGTNGPKIKELFFNTSKKEHSVTNKNTDNNQAEKKDYIDIYTDGACSGNPGPAGYGIVIKYPSGERKEISAGYIESTNNRMELAATIVAMNHVLKEYPQDTPIKITSDSKLFIDGINKNMKVWKAKGWKKSDNKEVKNKDLWVKIDSLTQQLKVEVQWVKGHSNHPENERCDVLAVNASKNPKHVDNVYVSQKESDIKI